MSEGNDPLLAYLRNQHGGVKSPGKGKEKATEVSIPPLDDLLLSSDDDEPIPHSSPHSKPTRPVPSAPSSAPPFADPEPDPIPPTPTPLSTTTTDIDDLLTSSTLSFIQSSAYDVLFYTGCTIALYVALTLVHHILPYPIRFLHFALKNLERLSQFLVWITQYLAIAALAVLALGFFALALGWTWFKWGERAWDGRSPVARAVFIGGAGVGLLWRLAPRWVVWIGLVGLAGFGWKSLNEEVRGGLWMMVRHPRKFYEEAREIYREKKEEFEREEERVRAEEAAAALVEEASAEGVASVGEPSGKEAGGTEGRNKKKKKKGKTS